MSISKEDILAAFQRRAATRYYDGSRKISEEDMNFILELGRLSPSSVGSEPWRFLVIQNPELRAQMKPIAWGMAGALDDASHVVAIIARRGLTYDSPAMQEGIRRRQVPQEQLAATLEKYRMFQNDCMELAGNPRALFDWACKQTYIALANMMTGAALIGIDSCPIEGFHYRDMDTLLSGAGLYDTAEWGISVAATFGYRARDIRPKPRRDAAETVVWAE